MKNPIKNVVLEFPCREQWDKLEIVQGGRLCHSCAHVVRDFRDCSQSDLDSAMKTQSHVCGIFRRDQLSLAFLKVASLALATTVLSACVQDEPTATVPDIKGSESTTSELPPFIEEDYVLGILMLTDSLETKGDTL